ncbi:MAG TPA: TIGR03619 family F420-dependent LLM class oxidoreductase [Myxococcota bacterium]|nr:TIGR03619 family F420-dependent LLM class oxidoreductase [Myxococcota bacterium]
MLLGVAVRSMGPQSQPELLVACVRAAERAGLADVWVQDHLAIPPDDAEGSGGRYLDPLTALAWLAGQVPRIGLGTAVLNLPYRPALPTAKAIATLQELCAGRLRLGVGLGWMEAEFRALGVPRARRGRTADETLAFLHACFDADVVSANGQEFLFLPRPPRPPIYVGGTGERALRRAVRFGDGWMPMAGDPAKLAPDIARLRELAAEAGRAVPEVIAFTGFDPREPESVPERVAALAAAGVSRLVAGARYATADDFARHVAFLAERVVPVLRR